MGARTQLTFFPDRVMGALNPPHDASWTLLTKDVGGNEFFQFYRYDLSSGESTLLTDGKSRNTGARWSSAGDRIERPAGDVFHPGRARADFRSDGVWHVQATVSHPVHRFSHCSVWDGVEFVLLPSIGSR